MNEIERWLQRNGLNNPNIDNTEIQDCKVSYAIQKFCEEKGIKLNIHNLSEEVENEKENCS